MYLWYLHKISNYIYWSNSGLPVWDIYYWNHRENYQHLPADQSWPGHFLNDASNPAIHLNDQEITVLKPVSQRQLQWRFERPNCVNEILSQLWMFMISSAGFACFSSHISNMLSNTVNKKSQNFVLRSGTWFKNSTTQKKLTSIASLETLTLKGTIRSSSARFFPPPNQPSSAMCN